VQAIGIANPIRGAKDNPAVLIMEDKPLDQMSIDDVTDWLIDKGFSREVQEAFEGTVIQELYCD
jgi:hypothetical protein